MTLGLAKPRPSANPPSDRRHGRGDASGLRVGECRDGSNRLPRTALPPTGAWARYDHDFVKHSVGGFVKGMAHTNGVKCSNGGTAASTIT